MAMNMDQMQIMMAKMHQQNVMYDTQLAQHFQDISNIFSNMAQGEYQMFQMHLNRAQGTSMQMQNAAPQLNNGMDMGNGSNNTGSM